MQLLAYAIGRGTAAGLDASQVAADRPALQLHLAAELIGAAEPFAAVAVRRHGENKRAAVAARAASRVPILVRHGAEPRVFLGQAAQGGVDGLLLGADEADLHLAAIGEREDLRPQHGRIRDAQQLEAVLVAARDDEEPRAVRRGVNVGGLDLAVDGLLFSGNWSKSSSVVGARASMMYSSGYS